MSGITSVRRQVKNMACNYTEAQVKVREATSNDPWGPSGSLMNEIADMTHYPQALADSMQIIFKRLGDHGRNWRHVYKSLCLLDHLIKNGSEKVSQICRENIYAVETLKDFQHVEENRDKGLNIREKSKQIVALLKYDNEKGLKEERTKAQVARRRFDDRTSHRFHKTLPATRRPTVSCNKRDTEATRGPLPLLLLLSRPQRFLR